MMESRRVSLILVSFLFLAACAGAENDDEYWRNKEEEARRIALDSYHTDPMAEVYALNAAVHKSVNSTTRRDLGEKKERSGCRGTNPMDRCWRCKADWAENRQRLAGCAKGFGRKAYGGGKKGEIYVVTDPSDNELDKPVPGTIRWGVIQPQPLWIIFDRDMVIKLREELIMTSNKTLDGRGVNVRIAYGASLTIQFISNVIVHGLHIHNIIRTLGGNIRDSTTHKGFRTASDGDGINVFGASNLWIDHNSFSLCSDGVVDVIYGSTAITISNNLLTNHNDVMLLGANDDFSNDTILQVTVAFNHFSVGLVQRMPRVRYGFVHVVNNDYTMWQMYAIGGSSHPTIISQGNRFIAPDNPNAKEITKRDYAEESVWSSWNWTTDNDLYMNGAFFRASGVRTADELTKNFSRYDVIRSKTGSHVVRLTRFAGALGCRVGVPC